MAAVWFRLRIELRSRWKSVVAVGLVAGLAGAVTLATTAGVRRTSSAFDRFTAATASADVLVNPDRGSDSKLDPAAVRRLPEVAAAGRMSGVGMFGVDGSASSAFDTTVVMSDGRASYSLDRPKVLQGRMPGPDEATEILVNRAFVRRFKVGVGGAWRAALITRFDRLPPSGPDEAFLRAVRAGGHRDSVTPVTLHVAGVGLDATSLVTDQAFDAPQVVLTPAFARRLHPRVVYWGLVVRLQPGTPMGRFEHDVDALVPDESIAYQTLPTTRAKVERAVRPESGALTIFAIVVALIGLFVVGQTLARQTVLDAGDHATLRGLGCARWQLFTLAMARTALAAGLGAVVALTGAFLLSPMMPIGVARLAEPSPGFDFDGLVLLAGAALVFLAVMVLEVLPAWHAAVVSDPRPSRRHRLVELSIRAGMPPVPAAGVRMALDPATDAGTVPVRTTISSALVAVAAVTAALVIAASLGHLVRTPRLYGWNWDATVAVNGDETGQTAQRTAAAVHALRTEPGIGTFARFDISTLQLGGHPVTTIGTRPGSRPSFVIAAGRRPRTPHAIALGARTMQTLGVRIGDRVTATDREGRPVPLGVVGRVVLPALGTYVGSDKTSPGEGALVSESALAELAPRFDSHDFVVDFAAGTSTRQQRSAIAHVRRIGASEDTAFGVPQPADIVAYREVRSTPTLLAAALAALATLTLAHGLISSVRRRRRELGMLKTMGFTRRQVSAAISWQATTVILIALAIGVPLGIVGGRWAWTGLANNLGTVADPLVPGGTLALGALVVLVAGNLVAYLPGRVASRLGPAAALRSE